MVEATTGWLETYPVPHATARNTILGLEKQVLWRHGTPERIESDNGTHFWNNLIDTWAKEHGIEWVYHIPYHAPASGKIERGSKARYSPTEKEILAAYEGIQDTSEVVGTEAQLLLAPRLPVLGWMFKGRVPSTHHATDATWSKWVTLIMQRARMGNADHPGILEVIMDWPEGPNFRVSPEEATRAEEAPLYNKLPENEKPYALLTDGA
ncbi:hypothetical protein GRJ2_003172900 [Grus japonensis]|uniref:Integrase catalytic domain-containing protein n=1 Tax=Grus japonensis TaxID=30415 RepID=A0ABC9YAQ2_GRUJA